MLAYIRAGIIYGSIQYLAYIQAGIGYENVPEIFLFHGYWSEIIGLTRALCYISEHLMCELCVVCKHNSAEKELLHHN